MRALGGEQQDKDKRGQGLPEGSAGLQLGMCIREWCKKGDEIGHQSLAHCFQDLRLYPEGREDRLVFSAMWGVE